MSEELVYVTGLGASTAVGRDAWSSAAAVRAGISGFTAHPYMTDTVGQPIRVAFAPWLDIALSGVDRFEALLTPAIDQALAQLSGARHGPLRIGLALGLPNPRPGLRHDLPSLLQQRLGMHFGPALSSLALFPHGHAAGLLALAAATRELAQGTLDACVVAGVDSYLEAETLEWLEASDQLHGAGPLNNAWGFIPGEGAGALLLMRRSVVEQLGLVPLARVLAIGTAFETHRIKTETVCIGHGLSQAFRGALAALPLGVKVTDVYCDMNGEPYRADEYGFTALRTKDVFESASDFVAPADCWGDVAAAGAPLHLMLAAVAGLKCYSHGQIAFAWASAEEGERGAALLVLNGTA